MMAMTVAASAMHGVAAAPVGFALVSRCRNMGRVHFDCTGDSVNRRADDEQRKEHRDQREPPSRCRMASFHVCFLASGISNSTHGLFTPRDKWTQPH